MSCSVRFARPEDGEALLSLTRIPMRGTVSVSFPHNDDFFAAEALKGRDPKHFLWSDDATGEIFGFGLRCEGRFWIPDGFQGVLETPGKLESIRASYDTFTARPCDLDAVRAFAPELPVVASPHVNASVLASIPSELCDMSPTDLIYLRPPVFVDPKPVRVFPEA